jgi:DNA polymerase-3 subunit gamma/tau
MTALYRKYRPQRFEDLVGQAPIRSTLLQALKQDRLVHAYLFSGPRGTGKTSTARLIAKAILCEQRLTSGEPCNECEVCQLISRGELVDLVEIDAASNRGIDEIRDLREKIRYAPTRARSKVYIIDEVHMLTKEAFNALLKSLEEPPTHVYFILATTEIHKVPETILSRCQRYDFKRISDADIVEHLLSIAQKEGREVDRAAVELLAKSADGGMRDAISLFEQLSNERLTVELVRERLGLSNDQSCEALYVALGTADTQKGLQVIEEVHKEGFDLQQFTSSFLGLLRTKLHESVAAKKNGVTPKLLAWIELFDEAWVKLKRASIATLPLEIAVIRATQPIEAPVQTELSVVGSVTSTPGLATPTKRPEGLNPSSAAQEQLLHLEAVQKQLPKVYALLANPSLRTSFQTGHLKELDGKKLTFCFSSDFHFNKVQEPAALVAIEDALQQVMGKDVKVFFEMEAPLVESLGWETVEEPLP